MLKWPNNLWWRTTGNGWIEANDIAKLLTQDLDIQSKKNRFLKILTDGNIFEAIGYYNKYLKGIEIWDKIKQWFEKNIETNKIDNAIFIAYYFEEDIKLNSFISQRYEFFSNGFLSFIDKIKSKLLSEEDLMILDAYIYLLALDHNIDLLIKKIKDKVKSIVKFYLETWELQNIILFIKTFEKYVDFSDVFSYTIDGYILLKDFSKIKFLFDLCSQNLNVNMLHEIEKLKQHYIDHPEVRVQMDYRLKYYIK